MRVLLFLFIGLSSYAHADIVFDSMSNEFQSLEEVETHFHAASEELFARQDPRGAFVKVYEVVTHNIDIMLKQNAFEDPVWVERVGRTYANYFRRSFFSYLIYQQSGSLTSRLSSSWWLAFSENKANHLAVPVQLILSVNAHIQNDLPSALIESGASFSESCHRDYEKIGEVFARSFAESWQAVYRVDHVHRSDVEEMIGTWMAQNWITIFRINAWLHGVKLAQAQITTEQIDQEVYKAGLNFRTLNFWEGARFLIRDAPRPGLGTWHPL